MSRFEDFGFSGAIRKPFSISELGVLLEKVVVRR
jgi:hypothetical protein